MIPLINKLTNTYLHYISENLHEEEYVSLEDVIKVGGPLDSQDEEMDLEDFDLWVNVNDKWLKVKDFILEGEG